MNRSAPPAPLHDDHPHRRLPVRTGHGRRRAILLALLVHGLLLGLLFVGLNWQTKREEPVQAELWVPAPVAAPKAQAQPTPEPNPAPPPDAPVQATPEPRPLPKPVPKSETKSEPKSEPRPEPKPKPEPRPQAKPEPKSAPAESPDIKAERARKDAERKQAEDKRRKDEQLKREAERKEADQKAAERKDSERKEAERKAAERKASEERERREEADRREAQAAETRRAEDIRRMQQQAGAASSSTEAPARSGPTGGPADPGYGARAAAAIRRNIVFQTPADLEGNPRAVFQVQLRPDCSLAGVRLRRSSGVPAWDQAAERGIQRTDPFPRPADGTCKSELEVSLVPRDAR